MKLSELRDIRENIKRLNDKLTLIFTGVGVVAGVKPNVLWPAIRTHWIITAVCLLFGVAPIQELVCGNETGLKYIYWAKFMLLWLVVIAVFCFVMGWLEIQTV